MSRKIIATIPGKVKIGLESFDYGLMPILDGLDNVQEGIGNVRTHGDITSIISTEGFGNRPQIAYIALNAIETKLFGKSISVGTESRSRISLESDNIFRKVWDAIIKFVGKIYSWLKDFLGTNSEKMIEERIEKKQSALANIDTVKLKKVINEYDEGSLEGKALTNLLSSTFIYGYDPDKKSLVKPVELAKIIINDNLKQSTADAIFQLEKNSDDSKTRINTVLNAKDDVVVNDYIQYLTDLEDKGWEDIKKGNVIYPNLSYQVSDDAKRRVSLVRHPDAKSLMDSQVPFDVVKVIGGDIVDNIKTIIQFDNDLIEMRSNVEKLESILKVLQNTSNQYSKTIGAKINSNKDISPAVKNRLTNKMQKSIQDSINYYSFVIGVYRLLDNYSKQMNNIIVQLAKTK